MSILQLKDSKAEADFDAPHLFPKDAENLSSSSSGSSRSIWTWIATPSFQLGSGPRGPSASSSPSSPRGLAEAVWLKPQPRFLQAKSLAKAERLKPSTAVNQNAMTIFPPILVLSILVLMMPATGTQNFNIGQRDFNYRIPPSWSPENESTYSFRAPTALEPT